MDSNTVIAIALETITSSSGKFYFPSLTPTLSSSKIYDTVVPKKSTKNIINKINLPIESLNVSNYIELDIPDTLIKWKTRKITVYEGQQEEVYYPYIKIKKGTKVRVEFVGGDLNDTKIIICQ
jgi:hypothetical protein